MEKPKAPVVIVAAMSQTNRVIGNNNNLLWHVPDDLQRFKALTLGHPVIMGRKTFESILAILGKPLPNRTNIVVTRNPKYEYTGAKTASCIEEALAVAAAESPDEIHIGGGAEIYRQALPYVSRLYLTFFADEPDGDAYFPDFHDDFAVVTEHTPQEHAGVAYQWVDFVRKK